jgi:hypothetical protein
MKMRHLHDNGRERALLRGSVHDRNVNEIKDE